MSGKRIGEDSLFHSLCYPINSNCVFKKKYDVDVQSLLSEGYETADISQAAQELEQEEVVKSEREVTRQESGLAPPPIQSRPTNIPYQDV